MVLKSYAKINLSLIVGKKLDNGLHDVQSIYCLIDLFDKIYIRKISKNVDKIIIRGPYSKFIDQSKNSVSQILNIMRKNKLITNFYSIIIDKKIPVYAGLGGGTSNAATIFKHFFKKKISKKTLNKIVNYVGSDLRLFFNNQGYLRDLKTVIKFKKKHKLTFLIAYPKIKCKTRDIFLKVNRYSKKKKISIKKLESKREFINYLIRSNNDLQSIVEKKHPIIQKLLFDISKYQGCVLSRLTGSGSTCYGLFYNLSSSKVALNSLRKKYPKIWFSIAKTI